MKAYLGYKQLVPTVGGLVGVALLSAAPAVWAAGGNEKDFALDTVVITGEKFDRDLKNTASSVSIKTSKELEREELGNSSVHQVLVDMPNVVYSETIGAPIIRGQDTQGPHNGQNVFWGGTVPRATINLDGHYLNYNEMYFGGTSIWDVDQIEVFRGPQTTSQGANAIAGAIIVNTKDPSFTPGLDYQVEAGNYKSRRASIAATGPLAGEDLAGRIAVDYSSRDTFIKYKNPKFVKSGIDHDFKALTVRSKLLWVPTDLPDLDVKLTFSHTSSNRPTQESASGKFSDLEHLTNTMPTWNQISNTGIVDIGYALTDEVKLSNQLQYTHSSVNRELGTPNNGDATVKQSNWSNETRVTFGRLDDTLSGMGGLYLAKTKTDEELELRGISSFDDEKKNLGIFGELNYRITDKLTLTTGLRFQRDQVDRQGKSIFSPNSVNYNQTFTAWLPKVSLAYAINPQWTVGGLVSRGYNPGGVSLNISAGQWEEFNQEKVWNYELFTRTSLLDNRLNLNANLFFMDFEDYQYNIPVEVSPTLYQSYTVNAKKSHAYGLEVGADYRLLDNLTIKAGAGALRSKVDKVAHNAQNYKGSEFAKSPGYTLSLGVSWDVTDQLNMSANARRLDNYYSDLENKKDNAINGYSVVDLRSSYQINPQLEIYGYVKNLFDNRFATYKQTNRGIGGLEAAMTEPRMFGVGFKGSF